MVSNPSLFGITAIAALLVAACGSSDSPPAFNGSAFSQAKALEQPQGAAISTLKSTVGLSVSLANVRMPTADELFNWAESTYPVVLPGPRPPTLTYETYTFRYYASTNVALGVNGTSVVGLVNALSNNPQWVALGDLADYSCSIFPETCGPAPATFDVAAVNNGSAELASFLTVCSPVSGLSSANNTASGSASFERAIHAAMAARSLGSGSGSRSMATYTSTPPADKLGSCGGRISFPDYTHANGVTTATRVFDNYCTQDSDTGSKTYYNGRMSFTNRATPTANGPITTQLAAHSADGISMEKKNAAGAVVDSQTVRFTNYVYTPGVPGGDATANQPDRLQADEIAVVNRLTQKTYRQTNYTMTTFKRTDGGEQISITGRGYRSNGQYFDLTTTAPIITNDSGDYVSGIVTMTGAANSTSVATIVPGSKLQAAMTVNGEAVTSAPACNP